MTAHPGYGEIAVGMEFKERVAMSRQPRIVAVTATTPYHAEVKVIDGPGRGKVLQKWRKHLADPSRWRYLTDGTDAVRT